ncbi:hypothetical protein [Bacillus salipaludis]|uniref:Type VII secretion protein EssA n=1 Tax=Bacillus salipaludis TaxID=2547811 RepID=A0ABW8RNY5_9BACI
MFSKISLIASLLFFLFGSNIFADSNIEESAPINGTVLTDSFHSKTAFTVATVTTNKANTEVSATDASKNETEKAALLTEKAKTVEPSFKEYIVPVSVGLLFIIGFGSYWIIFRRKHI